MHNITRIIPKYFILLPLPFLVADISLGLGIILLRYILRIIVFVTVPLRLRVSLFFTQLP